MFHRFSTRLLGLVGLIAGLPLLIMAFVATRGAVNATRQTADDGLREIADLLSGRIEEVISADIRLVEGLAATVSRPMLDPETRQALLDGYSLTFPELKRVGIVLEDGSVRLTNDPAWKRLSPPEDSYARGVVGPGSLVSDLIWREGFLPTIRLVRRINLTERLWAEIDIAKLWKIIEDLAIGKTGHTMVVDRNGSIIAHGAAEGKHFILSREPGPEKPYLFQVRPGTIQTYTNITGARVVGATQVVRPIGWYVVVEQNVSEAYGAIARFQYLILGILVLLAGGVAAAAFRTSRSMTRPIERLVAATKEVAKGNLSIEVPVTGSDERAQLTRAFNTMIRELAEMHRQIARRERMTVVGEVASELIHDLRHPIRNIENAASLLTSRGHDEEVREMFERVTKREFTGLNRFLENLEQLVAEPVIQTADVDVVQEVKALVESTRTSPTASQLQWVVQSTNGAAVARADRFALQRVLQNLVTNAVEAASPSGSVEIEIDAAEDIGIRIANTGALIPEERLAMLFDMLKTTKRRGIGLGLAICKKLVTAMGGTIQASNRESGGVVFSVRLPKASAQDQEAA